MSSKSTFSYAQAAKGLSGSTAPSKAPSTDTERSEHKMEEQSNNAPTESVTTASESETPRDTDKAPLSWADDDGEFTTVTSKHTARSKAAASSRTSSAGPRSTAEKSKEGDSSSAPNGTTDAPEKQSKTEGKAEKSEGSSEGSKDKTEKPEKSEKTEKSDKSEKAEKAEKPEKSEKSEKKEPPKELKAAPLPTVNIWQQRKEAQEAKAKTAPATTPVVPKAEVSQDSKTNSKKKGDASPEATKDRKKADGGKGRDEALPAVGDATSWPTPQVALGEEKKKAQEKTDKAERSDKSPVIRPHGKEKWMPVNYVPTAVFNTPLPTSGRGGRRATRGGRDGGRGAGHAATGDKPASHQATPGTKQAGGDRGRNEAGTGRAASLPAQSRRSTSTDVAPAEGRKAQAAERGRGGRPDEAAVPNGKQANGGENFARPQRDGKQFPKNQHGQAGDRSSRAANLAVDPQAAARANDRRVESGSKSADLHRDPSGFQDFNRERGGRSNRGRGPFSFGGQNAHFGTMPNNFVNPKSFGFNDRQRSQHALPNGTQQGNRMPMRSPSLPASGGMYGGYPLPNDMNMMYGFQTVAPGPAPGAMSAIPYSQYMEPFSLMSMLSMQLEYYFSVDNMCKDMFLRRQMDSQGFVPLSVIASFKRVKSLTEDFELLRHVSRQLRNVEYQTGEDGVDRLRPRENWAQWVLPLDQREPAARHEGTAPAKYPGKTNENVPFNNHADFVPNGFMNGPREFIPNGTGSRGSRTPLSSTAPEFMPSMPPSAQNEIANVGLPANLLSSSFSPPLGRPAMAQSSVSRFTGTPIDDDHSARGLRSNPRNRRPPIPWLKIQSTGPDADNEQRRSSPHDAPSTSSPPSATYYTPPETARQTASPHNKSSFPALIQSSETFRSHTFQGRDPRVWVSPLLGLEMGFPYRFWSQHLSRHFDPHMYNEFRRLAIDDLFTRQSGEGFNALMDFYRNCLLSRPRIPDQVLSDMVNLSRSNNSTIPIYVKTVLTSAIDGGLMEPRNRNRARRFFEDVFGKMIRRGSDPLH